MSVFLHLSCLISNSKDVIRIGTLIKQHTYTGYVQHNREQDLTNFNVVDIR